MLGIKVELAGLLKILIDGLRCWFRRRLAAFGRLRSLDRLLNEWLVVVVVLGLALVPEAGFDIVSAFVMMNTNCRFKIDGVLDRNELGQLLGLVLLFVRLHRVNPPNRELLDGLGVHVVVSDELSLLGVDEGVPDDHFLFNQLLGESFAFE